MNMSRLIGKRHFQMIQCNLSTNGLILHIWGSNKTALVGDQTTESKMGGGRWGGIIGLVSLHISFTLLNI